VTRTAGVLGTAIADALRAACGPSLATRLAGAGAEPGVVWMADAIPLDSGITGARSTAPAIDVDALVVTLFRQEGSSLVRLARLFVDDRNAAEDLVQEAFIRLARSAHRIEDSRKAAAYLRSIVLNLARDNNRRGLRHRLPLDDEQASVEDTVTLAEEHQQVIDALRTLPHRQRDCLILRYYDELGIDDIASTLGISRNSAKTHLTRGMRALESRLSETAGAGP
jgi:RNA polymerase sigma-70 factor (ECF subfamily)